MIDIFVMHGGADLILLRTYIYFLGKFYPMKHHVLPSSGHNKVWLLVKQMIVITQAAAHWAIFRISI